MLHILEWTIYGIAHTLHSFPWMKLWLHWVILGESSTLLNARAAVRPNIFPSVSNKLFASLYTYCSYRMSQNQIMCKKELCCYLRVTYGAGQLLRNAFLTWKNLWEETSQGAVNGFGFFYSVLRDRCFSLRLAFHLSLCNVLHDPTANRVLTAMLVPQPGKLSQLQ